MKADETLRANDHSTPFRRLVGMNENQRRFFRASHCRPLISAVRSHVLLYHYSEDQLLLTCLLHYHSARK